MCFHVYDAGLNTFTKRKKIQECSKQLIKFCLAEEHIELNL